MVWQSLITGILGIWLIFNSLVKIWMSPIHFIIVGVVVGVLGFWTAFKKE